MRHSSVAAHLAAACLLAACSANTDTNTGADGGPPPPPPDAGPNIRPDAGQNEPDAGPPPPFTIGLKLDTGTMSVAQGATSEQLIELNYDTVAAPHLALSVTSASGGLDAAVDPSDVDGRFVPSLRVHAADNATVGTQKLTVTASANGITQTADLTVDVAPSSGVTGIVVDQNGQPMSGIEVRSGDKSWLTANDGRFQLAGVTAPYDLDAVDASGNRAYRFVGLRRRDPRLQLAGMRQVAQAWSVEGSVVPGTGVSLTKDQLLWVGMDAPRVRPKAKAAPLDNKKFANTAIRYYGAPGTGGRLWGLLATVDADGHIAAFDAFGLTPASAFAGQHATGQALPLSQLGGTSGIASVTGPIEAANGYTLAGTRAWLSMVGSSGLWLTTKAGAPHDDDDNLDDHDASVEGFDALAGSSFLYSVVPATGLSRLTVMATAATADGSHKVVGRLANLLPDHPAPALTLPAAPTITTPAGGAPVAASSDFAWADDVSGRVYAAVWGGEKDGDPAIVVVTKDAHAGLPDFSARGVALPRGHALPFRVLAIAPYATVDEATGSRGLHYDYALPSKTGRGAERDGSVALHSISIELSP